MTERQLSLFQGERRVAQGDATTLTSALQTLLDTEPQLLGVLVFDDATGGRVDFDVRAGSASIERQLAPPELVDAAPDPATPARRGRPKLGVVGREVTLLPRHWEWLATQPGGSSAALRRLVDQARKRSGASDRARAAQEAAYRFMTAMAGDRPGFEEAMRALYAGSADAFAQHTQNWPADIGDYAKRLAQPALI